MGCEGGSIPKRTDVVKIKEKVEQIDESEVLKTLWTCCFLSKKPLERPVVACRLGRLYNKDSIVMFLLNNRQGQGQDQEDSIIKTEMNHIKSMKSVTTCKLTDSKRPESSYFACPITDREMNGKSKFYCTRICGCVLSEQAIRQFPTSKNCLICERKDFDFGRDLILLYPKHEEIELIRMKIKAEESDNKNLISTRPKTKRGNSGSIVDLACADISEHQLSNKLNDDSRSPENLLKEVKASGEIGSLKRTKVTDSLYINK